jgi:hypothetical protein
MVDTAGEATCQRYGQATNAEESLISTRPTARSVSMSSCTSSTANVGRQLFDDREARHEGPRHHEDAIVLALTNQMRQVVEVHREAIHDADQFDHLKIVGGRFTMRSALRAERRIDQSVLYQNPNEVKILRPPGDELGNSEVVRVEAPTGRA